MDNNVLLLKEIGFTELEARTYLILLYEGRLKPVRLIRLLSVHKSSVYNTLGILQGKGIVSKVRINNQTFFIPASPDTLIGLIKNIEIGLSNALSKLKQNETPSVETYFGKKSVRALMRRMLEEMLKGEKRYYDFGASGKFRLVLPIFWDYWQSYKKREKIKSYVIFTHEAKKLKSLLKDYVGNNRFLPKDVTSFTDTFIYNDVVVLFIWSDVPIAVYIKDKSNAESYKKQFRAMWKIFNRLPNQLQKLKTGRNL